MNHSRCCANDNGAPWPRSTGASGGAVSSTSQPITIVNREAGSGSRTGASIYFLGTNCVNFPGSLSDPNPASDGYATGLVAYVLLALLFLAIGCARIISTYDVFATTADEVERLAVALTELSTPAAVGG